MNKKKTLTVIVVIAVMTISFCSCGNNSSSIYPKGNDSVEAYFEKNNSELKALERTIKDASDKGMILEMSIEENNVTIAGKATKTYDEETCKITEKNYEADVNKTRSTMKKIQRSISQVTGIDEEKINVTIEIYNGDGTEVWEHKYSER